MSEDPSQSAAVELATELTIAWLSNPNTRATPGEVPEFLRTMHDAVVGLSGSTSATDQAQPAEEHTAAVSVRKSLASRDHIISLVDGKPYKSLKRHLSKHGMTPEDYRKRYGLRADYPMVAPAYAEQRREMAKKIGLGRKPKQASAQGAPATSSKAPRRRSKQVS
nr:MucR family transcriptional regulator [uncultured Sphingomonas sp.]